MKTRISVIVLCLFAALSLRAGILKTVQYDGTTKAMTPGLSLSGSNLSVGVLSLSNYTFSSASSVTLNALAYTRFQLTNLLAHNITLNVTNFFLNDEISVSGQGAASGGANFTVTIVDMLGTTVRWADGCLTNGNTSFTATAGQSWEISFRKSQLNTSNIVTAVYGRFK